MILYSGSMLRNGHSLLAVVTLLLSLGLFGGLPNLSAALVPALTASGCCSHPDDTAPVVPVSPCAPSECDCLGCLALLMPAQITSIRNGIGLPPLHPSQVVRPPAGFLAPIDYPPEIA